MTIENARRELPMWAAEEFREEFGMQNSEPDKSLWRLNMTLKAERFLKRYGLALTLIAAMAVYTALVGVITGSIVRHNTEAEVTERVTAQLRGEFQEYLTQQEQERRAAQFLTGDSSMNAAIEDLTNSLSVHVASLRMDRKVTKRGAEVYAWVDCARLASGLYGQTIEDVLNNKDNSVEGYVPGHAVRNEDIEIARTVATDYLNGKYPDRFYTGMQFAVINADGSVTARDMLFTNHKTRYWPQEGDN